MCNFFLNQTISADLWEQLLAQANYFECKVIGSFHKLRLHLDGQKNEYFTTLLHQTRDVHGPKMPKEMQA